MALKKAGKTIVKPPPRKQPVKRTVEKKTRQNTRARTQVVDPRKMTQAEEDQFDSGTFDDSNYTRPDPASFEDGTILAVDRSINHKRYRYVFLKIAGKGWYCTGLEGHFTDEALSTFITKNVMYAPIRKVTRLEAVPR